LLLASWLEKALTMQATIQPLIFSVTFPKWLLLPRSGEGGEKEKGSKNGLGRGQR